jgi:hypothetical protein
VTAAARRTAPHRIATSDRVAAAVDRMIGDARAEDDEKREKLK